MEEHLRKMIESIVDNANGPVFDFECNSEEDYLREFKYCRLVGRKVSELVGHKFVYADAGSEGNVFFYAEPFCFIMEPSDRQCFAMYMIK